MVHDALYPYMCDEIWVHNFADNPSTINNNTTGFYEWTLARGVICGLPFDVEYYKIRHISTWSGQWYIRMAKGGTAIYAVATNRDWSIPSMFGQPDDLLVTHTCGNFKVYIVEGAIVRTQTCGMQAAVSVVRSTPVGLKAAVALGYSASCGLYAAINGPTGIDCALRAAVIGDTGISMPMRAAVQGPASLSVGLVSAVGKEFGTTTELRAVAEKTQRQWVWIKAAIRGETGTQCALRAYVMKSRRDIIRLEFEPRLPQEFAQISVPNWPSVPFDSRAKRVG